MPNDSSVPSDEYESKVLGWVKEAVEEGDAFVRAQKGYDRIAESMRQIMGDRIEFRSDALSSTSSNRTAKIATDLSAMLTDIKPFWEFRTFNKRYERQADIVGKLSSQWYPQRQIDLKFNEVVRYWIVGATGWAHQYWNEETEDLDLSAEDPRDVLPIRPVSNFTIQDAFGVIHRRERTVNYLRAKFPDKARQIQADRDGSATQLRDLENTRVGKFLQELNNPFRQRLFGGKAIREMPRVPTADLFTIYLKDPMVNKTGKPMRKGQFGENGLPENDWSYVVQPGEAVYPRGRCIACTNSAVLYDGPSVYWHGMFPYSKLTLDPWPFSWLGRAPVWDLLPLQKSLDRVLRVIEDHNEQVAGPNAMGDKSVSRAEMSKLDTRRGRGKFMYNAALGKGISILPPPPLDQSVFNHRDFLIAEMEFLSGVRDLGQVLKLGQMPSGDTIERVMEAMSPAIRFRSRLIEAFMREFATMVAYNFAQFYTFKRRLTILGPEGITAEDFDFDPQSFIPAYLHDEDLDGNGVPTHGALARGPRPRYERAQEFLRQFTFHVAPGSLLASSEIERQLKYLMLARAGLIDNWTLYEVLGIPNAGVPPGGATTITERLMAQQQMGLGMQVSPQGRKATGQSMPRMKMSESG